MRKHIPPQCLFFLVGEEIAHCPLTVPSGDTPCVTAGDARRVNPWRSGEWRVERESGEGENRETSQPAPTVPRGDTPCVTAGDARRANPWRSGEESLRHRRCRTAPTFTHTYLYSLNAFSVTPPASESSLYTPPRVHPRHSSGITRG